jgi:hypothetical protein
VTEVSAPPAAVAGEAAAFSATARDALSPVHVDWAFDDGGVATGSPVDHRFASAGAHRVVAHVRDQAGNTTDVERTVAVSDPPPPPGAGTSRGGTSGTDGGSGSSGGSTTAATTTTTTTTTTTPPSAGPTVALSGSRLRASHRGVVTLRLACPVATDGGCTGTATLEAGAGRAAAVRSLAGRRAFSTAAGGTETVRLRLARTARRRLARRYRLAITAAVTARDGAGNEATSRHGYTLLAPQR